MGHGGGVGGGREHRQRIAGPMPGEIMTLANRILGNGGDSSGGKSDVIERCFGCYLEPLASWKVAALTRGEDERGRNER